MTDVLVELAQAAGLVVEWQDYRGRPQQVAPETLRAILESMELPGATPAQQRESLDALREEQSAGHVPALITGNLREPIPLPPRQFQVGQTLSIVYEDGEDAALTVEAGEGGPHLPALGVTGYHRLRLDGQESVLAVAPPRAWRPEVLGGGRRAWGMATQLYALRRPGDGGIGDFTALTECVRACAAQGADAVAISPVHALFSADLGRFSPYAPSSRLFLNPLYADPAALVGDERAGGIIEALGIAPELKRLEALELIDWPAAARLRYLVLRAVYDELASKRLAPGSRDPIAQDFERFRKAGGEALQLHATFEALHAEQFGRHGRWHWRDWPGELGDAGSREVAQFAQRNATEVRYHAFLQWLADAGLAGAQAAARQAGMGIGLVSDLAVGTDGGGSHAWSRRHDLLVGLSVGAPPDEINQQGQSWGLTTFSPRALRMHGFAPFLEMLRASLRHAGGLRMDHVLGLNRLWLVPEGASATEGAYLRYPLRDFLRLIALESQRHRALIVGEDLGTVPPGFREELTASGLMGMRVLWFEREFGLFREPSRWDAEVVAMTSTHDVPPVASWWKGHDIVRRIEAGQLAQERESDERERRNEERRALSAAFTHVGLGAVHDGQPDAAVEQALSFVARTPSRLAMLPIEDVVGLDEQPNLPGTVDEHPNWRRRLPEPAEHLLARPEVTARLTRVRTERAR
jgi:4-alpha-glucanotransferase